jgi:hypothetical protein
MKAEEIKLHFQKLNEQKIELNLVNDIDSQIENGNKLMTEYNDFQKRADLSAKMAENSAKRAVELSQKALSQAKELGVDTKIFESRLSMAKDLASRSSKSKIVIL